MPNTTGNGAVAPELPSPFLPPGKQQPPGTVTGTTTKEETVTSKEIKHHIRTTGIFVPINKHPRGHLFNFKSFILLISKCTIDQIPNVILLPKTAAKKVKFIIINKKGTFIGLSLSISSFNYPMLTSDQ